jgi:hypothetical protein
MGTVISKKINIGLRLVQLEKDNYVDMMMWLINGTVLLLWNVYQMVAQCLWLRLRNLVTKLVKTLRHIEWSKDSLRKEIQIPWKWSNNLQID